MRYPKTLIIKLALYLVLFVCGFILLIFSAGQYEESVSANRKNEDLVVCLSYLKTRMMMAEEADIVVYKNRQMLFVDQDKYDIYIFHNEGMLYEINVVNDYQFELDEADSIIRIDDLKMEESAEYISFVASKDNQTERLMVKK